MFIIFNELFYPFLNISFIFVQDRLFPMKTQRFFYLFLFIIFLVSCSPSKQAVVNKEDWPVENRRKKVKLNRCGEAGKIIDYAYQWVGVPYKYGGNTPAGFDCSGFVQYVFAHFNYFFPRSTVEQSCTGKKIKQKNIRPGDLVFFKGRDIQKSRVGHVGIVVETYSDNTFKFIHASLRGVTDDYSDSSYWKIRFLQAGKVLDR